MLLRVRVARLTVAAADRFETACWCKIGSVCRRKASSLCASMLALENLSNVTRITIPASHLAHRSRMVRPATQESRGRRRRSTNSSSRGGSASPRPKLASRRANSTSADPSSLERPGPASGRSSRSAVLLMALFLTPAGYLECICFSCWGDDQVPGATYQVWRRIRGRAGPVGRRRDTLSQTTVSLYVKGPLHSRCAPASLVRPWSDGNTIGRAGATPPPQPGVVARNLWRSIGGGPVPDGTKIRKDKRCNDLSWRLIGA